MDLNWLISPVAGSIIGYGTNYLAIKMLFRPHNAKYIGKFKVPFTPGLIPKEKKVLAKKIGETVESHLLSEDTLVQTLTSAKAKDACYRLIESIPKEMEASNKTIADLATAVLGADMEQSLDTVVNQLTIEILTVLKSKETIEPIITYIASAIIETLTKDTSNILNHKDTNVLLEKLRDKIAQSDSLEKAMESYLTDVENKLCTTQTPLVELIPSEYVAWLEGLIIEKAPFIANSIIDTVAEGEIAEKIKESIQTWAEENFNPMVMMFIKVDKIYEGLINFIKSSLDETEKSESFGKLLCGLLTKVLEQSPSQVINHKESMPNYKKIIINIVQTKIKNTDTKEITRIISHELLKENELEEIINTSNLEEYITTFMYGLWDKYMNTEYAFNIAKKIFKAGFDFIGNTQLSNLSMLVPKPLISKIQEGTFKAYTNIVTKNSKVISEVMDISSLVEDKISEFSSEEAEEIIISVVHNQLQAITWLGALLGFIIGVIPNFIK